MTIGGWIFMIVSWSVILGLFIFSVVRALLENSEEQEQQDTE